MREQQELSNTLKEQSMSQASLELPHYYTKLEDEIQDLKKTGNQIKSQVCITYNMSTVHL